MKLGFIPFAKNGVNKNLFFNLAVDFSEIVHVKLADEGTPVVVSEVLFEHMINKGLFIMYNKLITDLTEVYNFREILHRLKYTFIIDKILQMKSVAGLAEI